MPEVQGIDSTVPIRHAHKNEEISLGMRREHDYDWWDKVQFTPQLVENVRTAKAWVRSSHDRFIM
jgi:hypothetical protein